MILRLGVVELNFQYERSIEYCKFDVRNARLSEAKTAVIVT